LTIGDGKDIAISNHDRGRPRPVSPARTQYASRLLGLLTLLALLVVAAACVGYEQARALAPIESVDVVAAESDPPQYFARIVSGLPGGCASFEKLETDRSGDVVSIAVWNLVPAPSEPVARTADYRYREHNVALGTDFTPGESYRVVVNDIEETFTAQ
jgi:hypothetical protein